MPWVKYQKNWEKTFFKCCQWDMVNEKLLSDSQSRNNGERKHYDQHCFFSILNWAQPTSDIVQNSCNQEYLMYLCSLVPGHVSHALAATDVLNHTFTFSSHLQLCINSIWSGQGDSSSTKMLIFLCVWRDFLGLFLIQIYLMDMLHGFSKVIPF